MKNNSRNDILKWALTLFSQKGYESTSPNEIVEAVGITKPTLYYFFGDKEGLLDSLLSENYTKLNETLDRLCTYVPDPENYANDVNPLLIRVTKGIFEFAVANKEFYMLNISLNSAPIASKSAVIAEKYSCRQHETLTQMFASISAIHKNLEGKEEALAFRFISLLNAHIILWFRGKGDLSDTVAESIVKGFMHGIFS
ncbi:MAG: TetR/AcrR family transcriptional regulator [Defluviitaleaceae bacterium]|nr:TetR/AcrR family transcriptional regulator [Defluviitaleaceae bacterium]